METGDTSGEIGERGATASISGRRLFRRLRLKARELAWETRFYSRLGQTWPERLSIVKLLVKLYTARLMPFDTYRWEAIIRVRGAKYVVGVRTSEVFIFHEIYESRQYHRYADFVPQSGWIVFDVGANVGLFTVLQATQGAHVYAFEPNPASYSRLRRNVAMNGLSQRVHLFASALGDEIGIGRMHVVGGGTTGGLVIPVTRDASPPGTTVTITTLDQMVSLLPVSRIDLLKIDAEGAEVAVLQGAEQTLGGVQRVIIEYHSRDLLRGVKDILARTGFSQIMIVDYYAENSDIGQEEVGILYARRPHETDHARTHEQHGNAGVVAGL